MSVFLSKTNKLRFCFNRSKTHPNKICDFNSYIRPFIVIYTVERIIIKIKCWLYDQIRPY